MFIAIEGIDGSGKSTLAKSLAVAMNALGFDTILTREPGSPDLEHVLRDLFKRPQGPLGANEMAIVFTADRLLHVDGTIRPALAEGKMVVCDRYKLSTAAYQLANGASFGLISQLLAVPPDPDLTLYVQTPLAVARERLIARGGKLDSYERDEQKQLLIKSTYERIIAATSGQHRYAVLDGSESAETVLSKAIKHVQRST